MNRLLNWWNKDVNDDFNLIKHCNTTELARWRIKLHMQCGLELVALTGLTTLCLRTCGPLNNLLHPFTWRKPNRVETLLWIFYYIYMRAYAVSFTRPLNPTIQIIDNRQHRSFRQWQTDMLTWEKQAISFLSIGLQGEERTWGKWLGVSSRQNLCFCYVQSLCVCVCVCARVLACVCFTFITMLHKLLKGSIFSSSPTERSEFTCIRGQHIWCWRTFSYFFFWWPFPDFYCLGVCKCLNLNIWHCPPPTTSSPPPDPLSTT